MPDHLEVLHEHHGLDERMTTIAGSIGERLLCDLLVDVRAAGGTPDDLLGLLARMTASSVQFCFRQQDHAAALSKVSMEAGRLMRASG